MKTTPRRFGALVVSAFLISTLFLMFSSGDVAAEPYYSGVERTWDAASDGDASSPPNWNPVGVPSTGDNITFDSGSYNCNWNVEVTLGDFIITLGYTGEISVTITFSISGAYDQDGGTFNQDLPLTIGTDFTVSAGVFNAVGDMTIPGNWNTATGSYLNDDNVVTLTGASKTLAMHAADSFFNVTVSGSYTMNTDTNVRLRATISGTVNGTGDFLEPLPEFTSTPWPNACPLLLYESPITQTYWDTLAINDAPYWMLLVGDILTGVPGENDTGVFAVSLTLIWNDMVTYQNFTLVVCPEGISEYQLASFELAICLFFCFGIMLAGFKERILMILAGFVWMACGVAIYMDYGDLFMYMSVGLGAVLLIKGAVDLAD